MLPLLSHVYKPKSPSGEQVIFWLRAVVGSISLLDHSVGVSSSEEENLVEIKGRRGSRHSLPMRAEGKLVAGEAQWIAILQGPECRASVLCPLTALPFPYWFCPLPPTWDTTKCTLQEQPRPAGGPILLPPHCLPTLNTAINPRGPPIPHSTPPLSQDPWGAHQNCLVFLAATPRDAHSVGLGRAWESAFQQAGSGLSAYLRAFAHAVPFHTIFPLPQQERSGDRNEGAERS